ncbi:hypothetical protein [Lysobacter capsici]|uniref:hypothetical protein n=1 Tax=Lysobacter capsici TaxID=435897 RepID=UPI001C003FDA|nr:hypothetical protein [Lysobacter capsici]QWF19552.1 hypothetical protein KME82_12800 [Lysobacter capsici]
MNADALAPSLLCAACGLALAFAPLRMRWTSAALAAVAAIIVLVVSAYGMRQAWIAMIAREVTQVCWFGVVVCAASVYLPAAALRRFAPKIAPLLALGTGLCCGVAVSGQGDGIGLLRALPWLLLSWPAAWLVDRGVAAAVNVVCSWLLAVAVLAATLAWLPVTPGYLPDHLE